jgi:hypothetical protein
MRFIYRRALACFIIGTLLAWLLNLLSPPRIQNDFPAWDELVGTVSIAAGMFAVRSASLIRVSFHPRTMVIIGGIVFLNIYNIAKQNPDHGIYFVLGGYITGVFIGVFFRSLFKKYQVM